MARLPAGHGADRPQGLQRGRSLDGGMLVRRGNTSQTGRFLTTFEEGAAGADLKALRRKRASASIELSSVENILGSLPWKQIPK
jgi:hypothetical protein